MKQRKKLNENLQKITKQAPRTSLTIVLSLFIFVVLLAAIMLTASTLYVLSLTGVFVDLQGEMQYGTIALFMALISIVIGAVIALASSIIPLKPINNLIDKMHRLADGDFKARLEFGPTLSAHPAFKEVSSSFNKMAEDLENTEVLRNDFINNFSHEFKTPIVSITGFARLLNKENLTPEQRTAYLKAIEEESIRLSDMATNVLNLTKVENQTILTDVTDFNLSEQIRSSVLLLESKWTAKNIQLELNMDEHKIRGNEELLKQVWINLLDNAIKFSPDGATVSVTVEKTAGLSVRIFNSGSRISEAQKSRIFQKFYQTDESHAAKGNGIGLAIVKRVVQLHGATIAVSSDDAGTAFTVSFPQ